VKCTNEIQAGICGHTTKVIADSPDEQMVTLAMETDCKKIVALAEALKGITIDGYAEVGAGFEGVVLTAARQQLSGCCAGCVVPAGLFKAVQVAARVALPKDISMTMQVE